MTSIVKREQIKEIKDKISSLADELDTYREGLKVLQSLCNHDLGCTGHGHNYSIWECSICDYEEHQ